MVITLPLVLLIGFLLILSASFSASEAAMLSVNKVRLRHLIEQGHRGAKLTFELLTQMDRLIGTLLVANNLVNVAISAIGSWVFVTLLGSQHGLAIATGVMTTMILLVGEVTPKMFAVTHAEAVAFAVVRPLRALMNVLYPISAFFTWAGRWFLRMLRIPTKRRMPLVTEEEIKVMMQMGREAGILAEDELRMLHRIFEFSDTVVRKIMVPRNHIAGIDLNAKPEDVLDVLIEEGHSRIPVYQDSFDHVVGVVYARDLLAMVRHGGLFVLQDLIRPISAVPETKRVAELLGEFQRDKVQIAIIQDAKGTTVGLVTIEDVLEEIVGEIPEETVRRKGEAAP
jgi:CBS domain containing-hemolysin-like protein